MNHVSDHSPNTEIVTLGDVYGLVVRIGGLQRHVPVAHTNTLNGKLPVDDADRHPVIFGANRPVYHQQVTVADTRVPHGVALRPNVESSRWVLDQVLVEIEPELFVVVGRRGEPSGYSRFKKRKLQRFTSVYGVEYQRRGTVDFSKSAHHTGQLRVRCEYNGFSALVLVMTTLQ